jgi:O-antigen ligase
MLFTLLLALTFTAFAVLAWRDLKLALILLCGLTPTYLVRFNVGPVPSTMLEGFLVIAFLVFAIKHRSVMLNEVKHLRKSFAALRMTHLPIALIGIASIMAVIVAPDTMSALGIWKAYYVEPALFGFILWKLFDRDDYRKAFLALSTSGLAIAIVAIAQVLFHVGIPDAWATENRATSLFPYPNAVGLLLAPMVSALVIFRGRRSKAGGVHQSPEFLLPTAYSLVCITILLIAIGLAKTEAALVAIPAALYIVAMLSPMLSKRKKMLATSGIVLATTCVFLFLPSVASKLTLHDTSGLVRRAQWSETFHLLADHPYFGVGLNGYPTALIPYHDATTYEIFQYPHNVFLNVWSELGLLGLIGFLGLSIFSFQFAWRRREDPWTLACFAALLTMFIHGLVDVPFMKNDLAVVSVLVFVGMVSRKKFEAVGNGQ